MSGEAPLARLREALGRQEGFASGQLEVVIADRMGQTITADPSTRVLRAPRGTSVFSLRKLALEVSTAPVVIVTEDHCVPGPQWAQALVHALEADPSTIAVCGPVHDGLDGDPWDRAAFLCDYGDLLPDGSVGIRPTPALPGMNTAYRRDALARVLAAEPELLDDFWELGVHRRLALKGRFLTTTSADLAHRKRFGRRLALEQRFLQSRHVASRRVADIGVFGRIAWTLAAGALPTVLVPRILGPAVSRSGLSPARLVATLPPLMALVGAWTLGEAVGAAFGPGNSLAQIE